MGWFDDNSGETPNDGSTPPPYQPPPYLPTNGEPRLVQPAQTAVPPGATATSEGPVMLTPGYVPPPAPAVGANGSLSVARPSVNPSVVYTDQQGIGYDPGTLAQKWADPAFRNDPANARVGDILAQYQPPGPSANQKYAPGTPGIDGNLAAPGLMDLLGKSPLMSPWTQAMPAAMTTPFDPGPAFKAPTAEEARATPGYQFTLQQGIDALQKSAAAKGTLLTGGMMKSLEEFGSGLADSTYQQQYQNAYQTYMGNENTKYKTWAGNQTQAAQNYGTQYNIYKGNQTQPFNMLMSLAGLGNTATSNLNATGMGVGANMANTTTGIGNAQAAGTVGGANAAMGGVNATGNAALLAQLLSGSSFRPTGTTSGAPVPGQVMT